MVGTRIARRSIQCSTVRFPTSSTPLRRRPVCVSGFFGITGMTVISATAYPTRSPPRLANDRSPRHVQASPQRSREDRNEVIARSERHLHESGLINDIGRAARAATPGCWYAPEPRIRPILPGRP